MKNLVMSLVGGAIILLAAGTTFGEGQDVSREEMDAVKSKIERLEKTVEQSSVNDVKKEEEKRWYEKIDIAVGATGVLQGSAGVKKRLSSEGNVTDGTASFDLELSIPVTPSGKFFTLFEAGSGDGIDGDIPTLSGFNDAANDDDRLRLSELWYEHNWFGERLRIRAGKIDLTTDFDTNAVANDEKTQFLSGGFVNNLAIELPDDNGIGAMIWFSFRDDLGIGIGFGDADGDGDDLFDDAFSIAELDFKPKIGERQGNYRVYGWLNDKEHVDLKDPDKTGEKNYGVGLSFDQEITEVLTLFARYGWQRGSVSQIEHAWSAGLQCSGKFYGRKDDVIGLAYGMAIIGSDWEDTDRDNGIRSGNEHHVELYYNLKVNDHLSLSPDIQWVKNANGDRDNDDVWAFGLRARLSF
jgi:carbohydrate-selective porin OprB